MSESDRTSAHPPARNQRQGEPSSPGTAESAEPQEQASPETAAVPETGVYRPGAPSGEVAPT
jgi:hypothetical protein